MGWATRNPCRCQNARARRLKTVVPWLLPLFVYAASIINRCNEGFLGRDWRFWRRRRCVVAGNFLVDLWTNSCRLFVRACAIWQDIQICGWCAAAHTLALNPCWCRTLMVRAMLSLRDDERGVYSNLVRNMPFSYCVYPKRVMRVLCNHYYHHTSGPGGLWAAKPSATITHVSVCEYYIVYM